MLKLIGYLSQDKGMFCFITHVAVFWHQIAHIQSMAIGTPQLPEELPVSTALINITLTDPDSPNQVLTESHRGKYAVASPIYPEYGRVIHVTNELGENHGCHPIANAPVPSNGKWIALIQRGKCKFHDKVINAAFIHNASAVVIYNNVEEEDLLVMNHFIDNVVSVFIHKQDGERLAQLVDGGATVWMNISLAGITVYDMRQPLIGEEPYQVQPLLIISVTLISLLIVGLSALLVYGIRRAKSQKKKARRNIVFTLNNSAVNQRLLISDLHDYLMEPNNNDPNHNIVNPHYRPQ